MEEKDTRPASTDGDPVLDVDEARFEVEVLERSRSAPVIVDFWAEWCGPCKAVGPMLERLAREYGLLLAKVNIDQAPRLAEIYGVQSIPTVLGFRDGKPIDGVVGALSEPEFREFLNRLLPSETDNLAQQAVAQETAAPDEAARLYREILEGDAQHPKALLGLARVLVDQSRDDEARDILERLGPGGDDKDQVDRLQGLLFLRRAASGLGDETAARSRVDEAPDATPEEAAHRYELGCVLAAAGNYPDALAELLRAAESDRDLAKEKVRETMVSIFYVIGARSELADDYRGKLARALY